MFDVTNEESFESIKHRWIPELEKYAHTECSITLVGTKSDNKDFKVPYANAWQLATKHGFNYISTSALTGN